MRPEEKPKGSAPVKAIEKKSNKKSSDFKWIFRIFVLTFAITIILTFISESTVQKINILLAVVVLLFFILLGIGFDILGVAVASADDKALNSMAARKIYGARAALWFISKAPIVSNFCNDVIGDISSIISGSMGAVISLEFARMTNMGTLLSTLLVTSLISSLTVGGKALGKSFAMKNSSNIIHFTAKLMCFVVPEKFFTGK